MSDKASEPEPLMTKLQVSALLGVAPSTLAAWRCNGRVPGLPFVRIVGSIRYRRPDVEAFVAANIQRPGA